MSDAVQAETVRSSDAVTIDWLADFASGVPWVSLFPVPPLSFLVPYKGHRRRIRRWRERKRHIRAHGQRIIDVIP